MIRGSGTRSLEHGGGGVEEVGESAAEDLDVLLDEVGAVEVGLLDDEDECEVLLHDPKGEVLVLLLVVELDVGGGAVVVLVAVLVVEVADVDEDVEHVGADVVLEWVPDLLVVVGDVELGDEVEEVDLLDLAVAPEVVEQLADVGRAGDQPLQHPAEGLEDRGVVYRREEELDLPHVHVVLPDPLLQLYQVVAAGVRQAQVQVRLVHQDEHRAVVSVLGPQVLVYVVEGVARLGEVRGGREHVDQGVGVLEDHLLVGRRLADVVLGREVVELELYLLDLEVVALHLAGLPQQLGRLAHHLLEYHLRDAAPPRLGVPHQQNVHHLYNYFNMMTHISLRRKLCAVRTHCSSPATEKMLHQI